MRRLRAGSALAVLISCALVGCASSESAMKTPDPTISQQDASADAQAPLDGDAVRRCPDPVEIARTRGLPCVDHIVADGGIQVVYTASALTFDCNVGEWLEVVVREVTRRATSSMETGVMWTSWLQDTLAHSCYPPIDEQQQTVFHPIVLLQDRRMHCGQTARLVVDGLRAVGVPARVLQMKGHVSAEFFAGDRWVLAEADILNGGQFLRDSSGRIVGVDETGRDPSILASVDPYQETSCFRLLTAEQRAVMIELAGPGELGTGTREVWASVFDVVQYGDQIRGSLDTPFVIKKTASASEESSSPYFGWNYYEFCRRTDPNCTN